MIRIVFNDGDPPLPPFPPFVGALSVTMEVEMVLVPARGVVGVGLDDVVDVVEAGVV